MRRHTLAGSLGGALALTLLATLSLPGAAQAGDRGASERASAGRAALAHAKAAFSGHSTGEPTMALRDLARTAHTLSGSDLSEARGLLARPTDPASPDSFDPVHYAPGSEVQRQCGTYICVHWVEDGSADATDPAFAQQALQLLEDIDARYRAAGYRGPLPDQGQGGDTRTDIYLADVGAFNVYGYCNTDLDDQWQPTYVDGSAVAPYCVFDNDFTDFGGVPLDDLEVTAAHEYFHAVQFGYDFNDDLWVYETTATWVEDEMFDDVDGNLFYLYYGQMGDPAAAPEYQGEGTLVPLDYSGYPYGNWTWIRYLTERYPAAQAGLPTLVRDLWRNLDTTGGATDTYSLRALDQTLAARGTSTAAEYAGFSTANRTPAQSYSEGDSYPTPALAFGPVALSRTAPTATQTLTLDHLTSGTGAFLPFADGGALRLRVEMASPQTGAAAIVLVVNRDGTARRVPIALDRSGIGQVQVPFGSRRVDRVEVTMVNGSSAMKDCFSDPFFQFSCAGFGVDDGLSATVSVQSVS